MKSNLAQRFLLWFSTKVLFYPYDISVLASFKVILLFFHGLCSRYPKLQDGGTDVCMLSEVACNVAYNAALSRGSAHDNVNPSR